MGFFSDVLGGVSDVVSDVAGGVDGHGGRGQVGLFDVALQRVSNGQVVP